MFEIILPAIAMKNRKNSENTHVDIGALKG